MPFGQERGQRRPGDDEKPSRMTWTGTAARAREIAQWGRDAAGLPLVALIPPVFGAAPDSPEASWRLKAKLPVAPEMGGGEVWTDVPTGAVVRNISTGPSAWVDPVLTVVTADGAAAAFRSQEENRS